jgi:uncharacterized delta-60 repeat protein
LGDILQLQSDGKILYASSNGPTGAGAPQVGRLNADGSVDTSYPAITTNSRPFSLTLLSSGRLLVGGNFSSIGGVANRPLVQLTAAGALDPTFQPVIQTAGTVNALARQPDGKIITGGFFSEINGQAANGLVRVNPSGSLDATFAPALGAPGQRVLDVAVQTDGSILTATGATVVRYLSTGAVDNTFNASALRGRPSRLVLQPDGRILVANFGNSNSAPVLLRLLATGALDASFAPLASGAGSLNTVQAVALQPNGKVLVAGSYRPSAGGAAIATVVRLESTGAQDMSFTGSSFTGAGPNFGLNSIVVQPDGKVLIGGLFSAYGTTPRTSVARLNADGSLDLGFVPPSIIGTVNVVALQPNNRVLLGGNFTGTGLPANLARLLANGAADSSFGATAVPNGSVTSLLVQPNGAIVLGGSFNSVGGVATGPVARITASNVLAVIAPSAVAARTEAWPVPAHSVLNVAPDASAHPQSLDLLDGLGRPVRHQELRSGTRTSVSLQNLAPGSYLLRVTYAEGAVVRRIQVQ